MKVRDFVQQQVAIVRGKMQDQRTPARATSLLVSQHREVDALFARIGREDGADRRRLVSELADKLVAHMLIEQEIFYPACKREGVKVGLVAESVEEHDVASYALARLLDATPSDGAFEARLTVLKELIHHHVREEESELFRKAEKKFGKDRLILLAERMKPRFEALVRMGHAAALADAHATVPAQRPSRRGADTRSLRVAAKTGNKPRPTRAKSASKSRAGKTSAAGAKAKSPARSRKPSSG